MSSRFKFSDCDASSIEGICDDIRQLGNDDPNNIGEILCDVGSWLCEDAGPMKEAVNYGIMSLSTDPNHSHKVPVTNCNHRQDSPRTCD